MNKLELVSLSLENFKGVAALDIEADGQDIKIYGDNATGKTTLQDAYTWLLTNKDSANNAKFQLKTVDQNNKELHGIDHAAEAVLRMNGTSVKLKKVFKEKYTKQKGSHEKAFTGHTTEYYVDDVPLAKGKFDERLAGIIDGSKFPMLTNPDYFNKHMKWTDRREELLRLVGALTDEEVFSFAPKELQPLLDALDGRSVEDYKKMIQQQKKKVNQELERLPVRIDEAHKGMVDTEGYSKNELESELRQMEARMAEIDEEISALRSGNVINEQKQKLRDVDDRIAEIRNNHARESQQRMHKLQMEAARLDQQRESMQMRVDNKESKLNTLLQELELDQGKVERMRDEYKEIDKRQLPAWEDDTTCPTCGQEMPSAHIEEARKVAVESFNETKSNDLQKIISDAEEIKQRIGDKQAEYEKVKKEWELEKPEIERTKAKEAELDQQVKELEKHLADYQQSDEHKQAVQEREEIEESLQNAQQESETRISEWQQERKAEDQRYNERKELLQRFVTNDRVEARKAELENEQREYAAQYEQLEHHIYLTEQFTRIKVNAMEQRLADKFQYARFKLFKEQVNGGMEETCETLYNGVPYESLNTAARINVGIDICQTLMNHYETALPIFVDNAESIVALAEVDTQVIQLVVSEEDKQLRVG